MRGRHGISRVREHVRAEPRQPYGTKQKSDRRSRPIARSIAPPGSEIRPCCPLTDARAVLNRGTGRRYVSSRPRSCRSSVALGPGVMAGDRGAHRPRMTCSVPTCSSWVTGPGTVVRVLAWRGHGGRPPAGTSVTGTVLSFQAAALGPLAGTLWPPSAGLRPLAGTLWPPPSGLRPLASALWPPPFGLRPLAGSLGLPFDAMARR